ncbi:nuclear transport factor 2 family protein [Phaeobacter sp. PT47_59]|uniref:nuclear transport factor 2 family protein n=1 Tax=Phaeobacter sp. PT47_59 TaxID=3029979 RepID=UPI0023802E1D|nr:nuclear transport factor 2 family protein [Phaeobacter sp. PT47_59]MDE4174496.1 nuclear transport factor 2 family protein [Phaeobacter sp. PT47_59]
MTSKTDLVRFWVEEVWSKDNDKILGEMFAAKTIASGPVSSLAGKDFRSTDIVSALKALFQCKPDLTFTVMEEMGDWILTCFTISVNEHPQRPPFEFDGQMVFKILDDKIAEIHSSLNYIKMFEGLGQMPEDTLLVALTGAELDWK